MVGENMVNYGVLVSIGRCLCVCPQCFVWGFVFIVCLTECVISFCLVICGCHRGVLLSFIVFKRLHGKSCLKSVVSLLRWVKVACSLEHRYRD